MNYTLTLHVNLATVTAGDPGHGWIALSDGGGNSDSYGFYPKEHGLETLIGERGQFSMLFA